MLKCTYRRVLTANHENLQGLCRVEVLKVNEFDNNYWIGAIKRSL